MKGNVSDVGASLAKAIGEGSSVEIIYTGGSSPGARRRITPLELRADGMVRARCHETGAVKTFAVMRIQFPPLDALELAPSWAPAEPPVARFETLRCVHTHWLHTCEGMGWHVVLDDHCLGLHALFKNGKPRRTAMVALSFDDYTPEGGTRQRPWVVRAQGADTKTFGTLDRAAELFGQLASALATAR